MPRGFGGNMQQMLQQAQKMQAKIKQIQDEAGDKTVEATSGGGMVKAVVNGRQEIVSLSIEPEIVKAEDCDMLQDLVVAAINEGIRSSQKMVQDEMASVGAGLNIPGLGGMF